MRSRSAGHHGLGGLAGTVLALAVAAAAAGCGSSSPGAGTGNSGHADTASGHHSGLGANAAGPPTGVTAPRSASPAPPMRTPAAAANGCSIATIAAINTESTTADAQRTASWTTIQANGWTAFVPDGDWHLSASDAGADVVSPSGTAGASLETWYAQTPQTLASVAGKIFADLTDISVICRTPVASSASGSTQATEFTADNGGTPVHGIVVASLLTPTEPDLYVGETRTIYAPVAQWTTGNEQILWLIIKRAIQVPQQP